MKLLEFLYGYGKYAELNDLQFLVFRKKKIRVFFDLFLDLTAKLVA